MIRNIYKSLKDEEFHQISDYRAGSWIHVEDVSYTDLKKITELTELESHDLQDCMDKYEVPRIEHKDNNVIIFVRHTVEIELGVHTETLAIILTPSYLITISPSKCPLINKIIERKRSNLTTTQKSKLLLFILLRVIQDFTNKIKVVRNAVIELEKHMKNISSDTIITLTKNE